MYTCGVTKHKKFTTDIKTIGDKLLAECGKKFPPGTSGVPYCRPTLNHTSFYIRVAWIDADGFENSECVNFTDQEVIKAALEVIGMEYIPDQFKYTLDDLASLSDRFNLTIHMTERKQSWIRDFVRSVFGDTNQRSTAVQK